MITPTVHSLRGDMGIRRNSDNNIGKRHGIKDKPSRGDTDSANYSICFI